MRKSLFFGIVLLVLVAFSPASFGEDCSCTAPDGSCNASISCTGGCAAICGEGGNCSAYCSGAGSKQIFNETPLRTGPAPATPSGDRGRVTVEVSNLSPAEVSALLSDLTKRETSFAPNKPGERISISATDFPLHELLQRLGEYGAIGTVPRGILDQAEVGDRVSLHATKVTGRALEGIVQSLSSGRASFEATRPTGLVSLQIKNMPLQELLEQLTVFGKVTLDGQPLQRQ